MAIISNPGDFTAPAIKVGPKTATVVLYVLIGAAAIAIGVPAAFMSADASMFDECYSACATAAQYAAQ